MPPPPPPQQYSNTIRNMNKNEPEYPRFGHFDSKLNPLEWLQLFWSHNGPYYFNRNLFEILSDNAVMVAMVAEQVLNRSILFLMAWHCHNVLSQGWVHTGKL